MNVKKANLLNESINNCKQLKSQIKKCHGSIKAAPLVDSPKSTQSIMLITRDPSNNANATNTLVGYENNFFVKQILPMFYKNYDIAKGEKSMNYFNIFKNHFHDNVYWTHYAKCFPGVDENNHTHKKPNDYCAKTYINTELTACKPELLILIGDDIISFLTGYKTKDLISNTEMKQLTFNGEGYNYLFSTHPSNANAYKKRYKFNETKLLIQETYMSKIGLPNVTI